MSEKPLIYFVLGAPGSGRRELLVDLIQSGLDKEAKSLLLISDAEEKAFEIPESENLVAGTWTWNGREVDLDPPSGFSHIFLVADGRGNPVDQVEAFSIWLQGSELELGRVFTIVHAGRAHEHKELMRWHEACIHFSDVVLINRREGVPQKWLNEFIDYFKKDHHYPCHIEQVKGSRMPNPTLVLEPEPRRISLLFDELPLMDDDEDDEPGEEGGDPYLQRLPSGRRAKQIPDINKYLEPKSGSV